MNGNFGNDEIRPTVNETLCSAFRVSVTRTRMAAGHWFEPVRRGYRRTARGLVATFRGEAADFGQLHFLRGRLERYAIANGRTFRPRDGQRKPKGKAAVADHVLRYLAMRGTPFPEQWRTHDGGREVEPTEQAAVARAVLHDLGVDGNVPFAQARARASGLVERGPTTIARGARFLGGITRHRGRAAHTPNSAETEIERAAAQFRARRQLDAADAAVLDLATSPMSARAIGEHFGRHGKYAERWAIRAIDAALARIAA
jgi:hypothetical protein